jgi:hypothetical protein
MVYVKIRYADGNYSLRKLSDKAEADAWEKAGQPVYCIQEAIWRAYEAHLDQCQLWYQFICHLDNIIHDRRGAVVDGTAVAVCSGELVAGNQTTAEDDKVTCPKCKAIMNR